MYVHYRFLPQLAKIITKSRAVDVHALIGNIGGYIGLFLGILHYYTPYCIQRLFSNSIQRMIPNSNYRTLFIFKDTQ